MMKAASAAPAPARGRTIDRELDGASRDGSKGVGKKTDRPRAQPAPNARKWSRESLKAKRERLAAILQRLHLAYPEAHCALIHENPLQLLVATILSAQCTDARVNQVTPDLFRKYPDAAAFAAVPQEELEAAIHSTGFYRNKARNIIACCRALLEKYGGELPTDIEALTQLAGVGRKTANVILGACFSMPAITVDTHCGRLSRQLGLTKNEDPVKAEMDLQRLMPPEEWWFFSSSIITHGREICHARGPECERCLLSDLCAASRTPTSDAAIEASQILRERLRVRGS